MMKTPEPARMRLPTPDCGQHNDEILRDLGYNQAEIAELRDAPASFQSRRRQSRRKEFLERELRSAQ